MADAHDSQGATAAEAAAPLSKNERRRQEKKLKWERERPQYLAMKKEKKRLRKEKARLAREENGGGEDRDKDDSEDSGATKRRKVFRPEDQTLSPLRVVLDLTFDSLMNPGEAVSTSFQVQMCHAGNKRVEHPCTLYATGVTGRLKERFDGPLKTHEKWTNFVLTEEDYPSLFKKEELVYLTADSPNVLKELDTSKVYIIGGIVDRNRYKNLCFNRAQEQGIAHAQLPIGVFLKLETRKVLAINHVFDILMGFNECKDWLTAFNMAIPSRKLTNKTKSGKIKVASEGGGGEPSGDGQEEEEEDEDEEEAHGGDDNADDDDDEDGDEA